MNVLAKKKQLRKLDFFPHTLSTFEDFKIDLGIKSDLKIT